ncbi:hypothetical protein GCM10010358_23920 [Streptomyces minutiscleroticus]|uniref:Uncharacterized protein n=1 Tax=Streptomyces minutiscleroticus TaxID=68238 RepID=A0A918NFD4_9ACTN|nr:hypothetical protein GCM10010358_23920 [Streptomyces minutiscleroticus]
MTSGRAAAGPQETGRSPTPPHAHESIPCHYRLPRLRGRRLAQQGDHACSPGRRGVPAGAAAVIAGGAVAYAAKGIAGLQPNDRPCKQ